jgi:hypothetical protein
MPDVDNSPPLLDDMPLSDIQKAELLATWRKNRRGHEKKKKDKNSHVYWYMKRETIRGSFYAENEGGPKILQQYRWTCIECIKKATIGQPTYVVLESKRKGVTTGMGRHLLYHKISKQSHFARIHGYQHAIGGGEYTELDAWSGQPKQRARLGARESTRRWFVKARQPFSIVESSEFQEMFLAHNTQCAYKSRNNLRNHIFDDFKLRREALKIELEHTCISVSFTLDIWTAPNRVPIFAIIAHWMTEDFQDREEVVEFREIKGSHTGDMLAIVVENCMKELAIKEKLFAVTGDNAGNNGTLCETLYKSLKRTYDDKASIVRPRMRFHGRSSWVRCLAHINGLIVSDVMKDLKTGTAAEAKRLLDALDEIHKSSTYTIPFDASRSGPAKIRLINLWALRSAPREQDFKSMPRTKNRRPIYDVDTRWNSGHDMMEQYIELTPEYNEFIERNPQIAALRLTDAEELAVHQLTWVLRPFKEATLEVSKNMPSITRSLETYWDLESLLNDVIAGEGKYAQLDASIRTAFEKGKSKNLKYTPEHADHKKQAVAMLFAAHTLDPRARMGLIKEMMPDGKEATEQMIRKYFVEEWPELNVDIETTSASMTSPTTRPEGISTAQWKMMEKKRAQVGEATANRPTSEIDQWLQLPPIEADAKSHQDPDFVRKWWKDNRHKWPGLSKAARFLLPTSASEVDVERLFSGCRDEFGIRRHSLKAETVRVLVLLRSSYTAEDAVDKALIAEAMSLDILPFRNSILWKPDDIDGHIVDRESSTIIPR